MSLLKQVKKELKAKFPDIYQQNNNPYDNLKLKLFKISFWQALLIYIICITAVSLYTNIVNFDFFKIINVNFEDNIKTFTTGIITLVSMNLFVTNLLFTHLKDERDDIQSIIDEKVNFKFVTYFGFSIIISILFLYFISPTIQNFNLKANILIFIFCSFLCYILQLVYLYNKVFNFIHKNKRIEIIRAALQLEFSKAFYIESLKKEFNRSYLDFIENSQKFEQFRIWKSTEAEREQISVKKDKLLYLTDIDIYGLTNIIKKTKAKEKYYYRLELDREYGKNIEINLLAFSEKTNLNFIKYYSFSKKRKFIERYNQENLDKLLKKVESNTLNNKFSDLKNNLSDLESIYTKYIDLDI